MDDDEKFIAEWKIIHEKTVFTYVIPKFFHLLVLLILGNAILLWIYHPVNSEKVDIVITLNAITVIISTAGDVLRWYRGEKRYRRIINKEFSDL